VARTKPLPDKVKYRLRRAEKEVTRLAGLHLPYVFGGGHVTPAPHNGPFDCSSFASHLAQVLGFDIPTGTTYTLANVGDPGEGKYFTLHIKNPPDPHEAHVIVSFSHGPGTKLRWAQCGGRDNPTTGGGPTWFRPTKARIAEFPIKRHFKGF
jgi:hypothetical protein